MMTRHVDEIPRHDRRWFRSRPERRHRCRRPHTIEIDLYEADYGRLILAIRHIGGRLVYQPVIYDGRLPRGEQSAALLFAMAARHPDPIPVIAETEVLRMWHRFRSLSRPGSLERDIWFEKELSS